MSDPWDPLIDALDAVEGPPVSFWLRDDDAVADTPQLRRLGKWTERNETEILLAVIPAHLEPSLAGALEQMPRLRPCVHGWAHRNHAPSDERKHEFGNHRPLEEMLEELRNGLQLVDELAEEHALNILVPPWNRISDVVVAALPSIGFTGLSVFAERFMDSAPDGLKVGNAHLDIIDWHGTRECRPYADMIADVAGLVRGDRSAAPVIGVLAHHLVHDEAAWEFLERFGERIRAHSNARWIGPREVFDG